MKGRGLSCRFSTTPSRLEKNLNSNWIAYDTETTGLNRHISDVGMFSYSLGNPDGSTKVHRLDGKINFVQAKELLSIWKNFSLEKVAHNIKFDAGMTQKYLGNAVDVTKSVWHDTSVQASILFNSHYSMRLKDLCWDLAGIPKEDEKAVKKYVSGGGNYSHVPEYLMDQYQHMDALRVVVLHRFFFPRIERDPKLLACYNNEMELLKVTYRMEERGLYLRRNRCLALRSQLESESEVLLQKAEELLGRSGEMKRLNLSNPDVARRLLYDEMSMPVLARTSKSGRPSADKNVIMELHEQYPDNKLLGLILNYRSWKRGISMMNSYLKFADYRGDGCIHPNINTNGARRTGRESCNEPNLQNVEKGSNEAGKKNPYPVPAREVFGPRPGYVNFHIDFRGIELRLLVEYSGDQILIDAIRQEDLGEGGGPHNLAASYFYPGMTIEEAKRWGVTDPDMIAGFLALYALGKQDVKAKVSAKRLRDTGKNAHFAGPYGASAEKIAMTLGLPMELARMRFEAYRRLVPNLFGLTGEVISMVKRDGKITNKFGRSFHVPREEAYIGTNYLIQGTASEILKRATVRTDKVLTAISGTPMNILIPIHDELVIECPLEFLPDAPSTLRRVREVMIDFTEFKVPMEIDVEISTTDWSHKYDFDINKEVNKWQVNAIGREQTVVSYQAGKRRRLITV